MPHQCFRRFDSTWCSSEFYFTGHEKLKADEQEIITNIAISTVRFPRIYHEIMINFELRLSKRGCTRDKPITVF